jgi:WD40 repeat protein
MMIPKTLKVLTVLLTLTLSVSVGSATLEWEILNTLKLDAPPLDIAISPDGKYIFILTHNGAVQIYDFDGLLQDKIEINQPVDQIKLGPDGAHLLATDRQNNTVRVIKLDFIKQIAINGSPVKGPADAPVVIADFSDFE